ncbi:hypothetical protein [Streptomyces formicae]
MRFNRRTIARTLRDLTGRADRLHPAALLVLVLVLLALAYAAAPLLVVLFTELFTALVAALKAAVFLAGAGLLTRLALRLAVIHFSAPTGRTA